MVKVHNVTATPRHYTGHGNTNPGSETFMILASVSLWILVPGCGFFYSGMARSKSAMSQIALSMWSIAIVSVQWFLFGYSLAFSTSSPSAYIGNFHKVFLLHVGQESFPSATRISELGFCLYQGVTATLPNALICGAVAERGRILPCLLFIFIWTTLVYCPIAYWELNPSGWAAKSGVIDFGGGGPVHVPAAAAALAYTYLLGPRESVDRLAKPHSMHNILLGTILIWFGSFGYNSGSAFGPTSSGMRSCIVTNLAGAVGGITWSTLDFISSERKFTGFGFCAGAVVGLIVITPASGFVSPASGVAIGVIGSVLSRWGHTVKHDWKFDDALDVFAMHGLSGIVGIILTGVFAEKLYGGDEVGDGGWMDAHWMQVPIQVADMVAGFVWSFVISFIVLFGMNKIPHLRLRMEGPVFIKKSFEDDEGVDILEMGLSSYEYLEEVRDDRKDTEMKWATAGVGKKRSASENNNQPRNNNIGDVNHWRSYWF